MKHYCGENDLTPEEIETPAPGNLPEETPKWITDAAPMVAQTPETMVDAAITNAESVEEVHQTLKDSHSANRQLYMAIRTARNEHVTDAGTVRDNRRASNRQAQPSRRPADLA